MLIVKGLYVNMNNIKIVFVELDLLKSTIKECWVLEACK